MCRRNDRNINISTNNYKIIIRWKVYVISAYDSRIVHFEFTDLQCAKFLMNQFLKHKRCSWIEQIKTQVQIAKEN